MERNSDDFSRIEYSDNIKEQMFDKEYKTRLEKRKKMKQQREERLKKRYNGE